MRSLRPDVPLLDVQAGDFVSIFSLICVLPDGSQVPLEHSGGQVREGWFDGFVTEITPINPDTNQGFQVTLNTGDRTLVLRTSRYNRKVRLIT